MGSRFRQRTRSAAIVFFSLQLTPLACRSSLNVDRQVFLRRPLFLLPSAGVHSIARRAGRSGAIRMTWPANRNLLFPIRCPAVVSVQYVLYFCVWLIPYLFMWLHWSFSSFKNKSAVTLTFDLWPWKPFQQCPRTWWIFVSSLIKILPLEYGDSASREIRVNGQRWMYNGRHPRGRTTWKHIASARVPWWRRQTTATSKTVFTLWHLT